MKRFATLLTATLLLSACTGNLGSLAKNNIICCIPTVSNTNSSVVCRTAPEADETDDSDDTPGSTLLTGFILNR